MTISLSNTEQWVHSLSTETITSGRRDQLDAIATTLNQHLQERNCATLQFVCTHNARRSQFGQSISALLATIHNLDIRNHSAGSEMTEAHPAVIESLQAVGLTVASDGETTNPHYTVSYDDKVLAELWSKTLDSQNGTPEAPFIAIMTCDAAANCPIHAAVQPEKRFALTFTDPKRADGTPDYLPVYNEIRDLIATELKYLYQQLNGSN